MKYKIILLFCALFNAYASAQNDSLQAVDLGLSVKWANMNVNATMPNDAGIYCAWGDVQGDKTTINGDHYVSSSFALSGSARDIATNKLGENWRIPTYDEFLELVANCLWVWQDKGNVKGFKVIGLNGNSIFLPIAGFREGDDVRAKNISSYYRIGTGARAGTKCNCLYVDSCNVSLNAVATYIGTLVRPVQNEKIRMPEAIKPVEPSKGEFIDMALSVKWASTNVGASCPEEAGDYYQWASTEKDVLPLNVGWESEERQREKREMEFWNKKIYSIEGSSYDIASKLGHGRMPTYHEIQELRNLCTWIPIQYKGREGYRIVSRNGNNIFLPKAGVRYYKEFTTDEGYYWTATSVETGAYALILKNKISIEYGGMSNNGTIRPVK